MPSGEWIPTAAASLIGPSVGRPNGTEPPCAGGATLNRHLDPAVGVFHHDPFGTDHKACIVVFGVPDWGGIAASGRVVGVRPRIAGNRKRNEHGTSEAWSLPYP